jgi:hypothetical protein
MNAFLRKLIPSLAALALSATVAAAQEATTPAPRPTPAPQAQPAQGLDYVDFTGFKSQIFEIKQRDPASLIPVLRPLGSGFKGATIAASSEFRTLSVRDFPENIATIAEAIKRLDVPQAPRSDIELHLHVLLASPAGGTGELPQEIRGAVAQLQMALNYKGFAMLTPIVQRTREGDWNTEGHGQGGTQGGSGFNYDYNIRSVSRSTDADNVSHVQLNGFQFVLRGSVNIGEARVQSNLSLKDGEQVVVGTASLTGGQALVLILSARVVK